MLTSSAHFRLLTRFFHHHSNDSCLFDSLNRMLTRRGIPATFLSNFSGAEDFARSIVDQMLNAAGELALCDVPVEKISRVMLMAADVPPGFSGDEKTDSRSCTTLQFEKRCVIDNRPFAMPREKEEEITVPTEYDGKRNEYYAKMEVPSRLLSYLLGPKGTKKAEIEQETLSRVNFVKGANGSLLGRAEIYSSSPANVQRASAAISREVGTARQRSPPTHFVSVPLTGDAAFRDAYYTLRQKILKCAELPVECRNWKILRPPEKVHVTVCVLRLFTEVDELMARDCFARLFSEIIPKLMGTDASVNVQFDGLQTFDGRSASKVNVVYAKVRSERLQKIVNAIDDEFTRVGFAPKRKTDDVIMHMTVLNTKYGNTRKVNASKMLSIFKNAELPAVNVKEFRICQMHEVDPNTKDYATMFHINLTRDGVSHH